MRAAPWRLAARWSILAAAVVAPFAVSTIGGAAATPARAAARPAIDTAYLYRQLYDLSTSDVYRVSGADGPPQQPSSAFNLPSTVNGWQELVARFKREVTSTRSMGPLGASASVTDHYFRRSGGYQFDSDDVEVTIPGASCAGQRVLLAAHPDAVPVPNTVADEIAAGATDNAASFGAARRHITLSNLGNGGAYDGTSGVAMTMAELQGLLRWYAANGTWPKRTLKVALLDAHESKPLAPADEGASFYVDHLIPSGPQGQYVLFANMDMNGLEYPAFHWGTDHFLNDLAGGGVGPWFTNIAASPLSPNAVYADAGPGSPWANIQANLPAIQAFRGALQASVGEAFQQLGQKYAFSVPLENPLRYDQQGSAPPAAPAPVVKPAYTPDDQARFSPVRDDAIGRFDQRVFLAQGVPGYNVFGAFDTNDDENPYPATAASKPPILQYAGYATTFQIGNNTPTAPGEGFPLGYTGDTLDHLNYWASGNAHGPAGVADPSEELIRALELPSTWTDYLLARDDYAGAVRRGGDPIAYFETDPARPADTRTVTFHASFSRPAHGSGRGLRFVWDFGDGTHVVAGPTVTHTYARPTFADVRLAVVDGGHVGAYRQAVAVDSPSGPAPATDPCGTLSAPERAALVQAGHAATPGKEVAR